MIDHLGINCTDLPRAESLHQPRLWPEYHPGYYGALVRDTEGNNSEAVCRTGD